MKTVISAVASVSNLVIDMVAWESEGSIIAFMGTSKRAAPFALPKSVTSLESAQLYMGSGHRVSALVDASSVAVAKAMLGKPMPTIDATDRTRQMLGKDRP